MRSLIRPSGTSFQQSGDLSWKELPKELQLEILGLNLSTTDLVNFAAASKDCSRLNRGEASLWIKYLPPRYSDLVSLDTWV